MLPTTSLTRISTVFNLPTVLFNLAAIQVLVQPINFPTVPRGTERLRFTPSPVHTQEMIDVLVSAMDELWSHCELSRLKTTA